MLDKLLEVLLLFPAVVVVGAVTVPVYALVDVFVVVVVDVLESSSIIFPRLIELVNAPLTLLWLVLDVFLGI